MPCLSSPIMVPLASFVAMMAALQQRHVALILRYALAYAGNACGQ
jgi:hypothetical protein